MKKNAFSLFFLMSVSFLLSGIHGNLYFLPLPMPYFWFAIFAYYSFRKSLNYVIVANLMHIFVITSFSAAKPAALLLLLNLFSLAFLFIRERFHTTRGHIAIASGTGTFLFLFINWSIQSFAGHFMYPQFFIWLGISFSTLLFALPLIAFCQKIDDRFYVERIDTLQNLRI